PRIRLLNLLKCRFCFIPDHDATSPCIHGFEKGRSFNTDLVDVPTVNQWRHPFNMGQTLKVEKWIEPQKDLGLHPRAFTDRLRRFCFPVSKHTKVDDETALAYKDHFSI